jgi:hypothetical protein
MSFDRLLNLRPIDHRRRLAISSRAPIPSPSQLLGAGAAAVVLQVGLADSTGLHPVGHVLVAVVAAGDPVHVQDNGLVDLKAADGSALVTDC